MVGLRRAGAIFTAALFLLVALSASAWSQTQQKKTTQPLSDFAIRSNQVNAGVVGVIAGGIGGTYIRIATDLASVLDEGERLRILAMAGKGSQQNITDLLYLRGVDVAIVQSDILTYARAKQKQNKLYGRISYITKLYNEEFHLVTRKGVKNLRALRGKKVNFGNKGSGTHMTSSVVFRTLGIKVVPTTFDYDLALEKLKKGEIEAMVYVAGKPAALFSKIKPKDGLKLLRVDYTPNLQKTYLPATFTTKDYPGLVPRGKKVRTVAVGAVMAVLNWRKGTPRHQRLQRFIDAFFTKFDEFQSEPRHPKWQEVNLTAKIPGWRRYPPAEKWLEKNIASTSGLPSNPQSLRKAFKAFLKESGQARGLTAADQDALFEKFLTWSKASTQ